MDTDPMRRLRASSSPELARVSTSPRQPPVEQIFLGACTNAKLLLKLIHEHKEATMRGHHGNRDQRISEMVMIIEDVKSQIQKSQAFGRRRDPELRRCNTDVKRNPTKDKKPHELIIDEKEKLRRELNASLVARKSLESICASIGKEKEIIAKELARKVQQMQGLEELVGDLKAQNEMLVSKVQACASDHTRTKKSSVSESQATIEGLQKKNKALSKQLLKSLDVYRLLKRKLRDSEERNEGVYAAMEDMGMQIRGGLERIHSVRERIVKMNSEEQEDMEREISELEHMFECFNFDISKHTNIEMRMVNGSRMNTVEFSVHG